jgi:hypothetical protein
LEAPTNGSQSIVPNNDQAYDVIVEKDRNQIREGIHGFEHLLLHWDLAAGAVLQPQRQQGRRWEARARNLCAGDSVRDTWRGREMGSGVCVVGHEQEVGDELGLTALKMDMYTFVAYMGMTMHEVQVVYCKMYSHESPTDLTVEISLERPQPFRIAVFEKNQVTVT